MKALTRYCSDKKEFGGYHYIDMPIPECGPEDVIIRLKAAAICGADMKHWYADLRGDNTSTELNSIRGHEFAGVVVKVGEKVIIRDYAGTNVKLDGEEYIIVRQDDIAAIVED